MPATKECPYCLCKIATGAHGSLKQHLQKVHNKEWMAMQKQQLLGAKKAADARMAKNSAAKAVSPKGRSPH